MAQHEIPADDAALEALLRDERLGPPPPGDTTPWDFVYRWPEGVVRERGWPIVSQLLLDEDAVVRARAIEFVRLWTDGRSLTTPRFLEVAEQHPELYADQQVEGQTLRYWLAFALSNLAYSVGERVARILRELVAHEAVAGSVIGRYYPDVAIARAPQVGDASAEWLEEAAGTLAMYRRDSIVAFLGAIRGLSAATRQRALAAIESLIKRDDREAAAVARREGFPPPIEPAPSAGDCCRAVGL